MKEKVQIFENEIIGHGAIAEALHDLPPTDLLYFASGVANSREIRESEYDRERALLLSQPIDRHIVYFSSLCTFFEPDTRYSKHKMEMEDLVRNNFFGWTIVRIGNISWGQNPNQLVPFIRERLSKGEDFPIYDQQRHLLERDEFLYWTSLIPTDRNCEMNITGRNMRIVDIVEEIKQGKI
jgi:hypothetical protein